MITPSTYHAHSTFSDGKSTPEEMILAAIEAGCEEFGLSDHSYIEVYPWAVGIDKISEYLDTLTVLCKKYKDKIKVYKGIELDLRSNIPTDGFDYIIGSVHLVETDGGLRDVDASPEYTRETVEKYFDGDAYAYCEAYYSEVAKVAEITKCDIIGHFDLVTKFIERDPTLFSTDHPRYIAARNKALDALLSRPRVFEINTGAMSRGYRTSPYPAPDILNEIVKRGGKLVLNSDSHHAITVTHAFRETKEKLDSLGVELLSSLSEILAVSRG